MTFRFENHRNHRQNRSADPILQIITENSQLLYNIEALILTVFFSLKNEYTTHPK